MFLWSGFGLNAFLWAVVLFVGVILYLKKQSHNKDFFNKIQAIPGPKRYPIVGNAIQIAAKRTEVAKRIRGRFKEFGPIFRIWLGPTPFVNFSRAEHMEPIFNSTKHLQKSNFYAHLDSWLGDGLLLSKGPKWHMHRKLITPTFHFKILEAFLEVFNTKTNILIRRLMKESDTENSFDIYPYISYATLDIICETAMGTNVNVQEQSESDYVKSIYEITEILAYRMRRLWLHSDIIFQRLKIGKSFNRCLKILHNFTNKMIKERQLYRKIKSYSHSNESYVDDTGIKKKVALLDLLIDAVDNGIQISETSIREEVDTFTFEGHDTTATGISWCIYLLGLNQEWQEKCYQELNEIIIDDDHDITFEDIAKMHCLDLVIKETLRLYPPVPFIGRITEDDLNIGGYDIPAGTNIGLFIFELHRDPTYFPDPEKFDPDRFLPNACKDRHPYAYIPFSAGSRNCIGQKFAMLEEKIILAKLLKKYKFISMESIENVILLFELVMRKENGFKVIIQKRK